MEVSVENPTLEFEVAELPPAELSKTPGVPKVGGSRKAQKLAKQLMMGLSAQSFSYDREAFKEDPTRMNLRGDFTDPATYDDVDGLGSQFGEYAFFHQEVFRLIDARLLYQTLLAQYNHRGWAYFQLDVDADGKIIGDSLRGASDDNVLKVHSARAIRSALKEPLDENKRPRKFARSTFYLRFYYGPEGNELHCRAGAKGQMLTFCRFASEKVVSNNLVDHALTGGIHVNPFIMAERWEQYQAARIRAAGEFDPFSEYRRDPDYNL
ncbi:hypothetical protein [Bdellovibrio sp. HCB337]|uniref:hypothetical protein n=1 Tax=Bdellovibrio sp. HCB337 TaxID=3394358 RepID=UPI0039A4211D